MQVVTDTDGEGSAVNGGPASASPPLQRAPTVLSPLGGAAAEEGPANPYLVEKALSSRYRVNPIAMQDLFASWDTDHSGLIDLDEVSACAGVELMAARRMRTPSRGLLFLLRR